jgi:homoserine dehydrogenase
MGFIDVALVGFGNVGRAFARYLYQPTLQLRSYIRVRAVADSSGGFILDGSVELPDVIVKKESGLKIRQLAPGQTTDITTFISSLPEFGIEYAIESLPTNLRDGQPALDIVNAALLQGTSVVTVDKGPMVHGFEKLRQSSERGRSNLAYNGTTGVKPTGELAGQRIVEIVGVLNGTTNFVLTEMLEQSLPFDQSLAVAKALGIAEPDPMLDMLGWDTACKIVILATSLMGSRATLSDVTRVGIGYETEALIDRARRMGSAVKLIGRATAGPGTTQLSVRPELVGTDSPFHSIRGTSKAALFRTADKEALVISHSSKDLVCETILDDLLDLANHRRTS